MTTPLTKQQRSILCAVSDWKAPWEVAEALFPNGATTRQRRSISDALAILKARGLVMFGSANWTYKISEYGRAVLARAIAAEATTELPS